MAGASHVHEQLVVNGMVVDTAICTPGRGRLLNAGTRTAARGGARTMERVEGTLTHLDERGNARMVDVSAKDETSRWARARAVVRMSPEAAARVAAG